MISCERSSNNCSAASSYAIFPAASGNDTRCVFFTCFFLSNTQPIQLAPPDDDSPAYSKEHDDDLLREETTQLFIYGGAPAFVVHVHDRFPKNLLLLQLRLLDSVQCPHCPEIVLFGFRGECRSGDPNKSTLPIIFQFVRHRSFLGCTSHVGRVVAHY